MTDSPPPNSAKHSPPLTEGAGSPHDDAGRIDERLIREVVVQFYKAAQVDPVLGPVFDHHIDDWDTHLDRMVDFWSSAILRSGRYSGRPVDNHRRIEGLDSHHFDRWIELFERTVKDVCEPEAAEAFLRRALLMRRGLEYGVGITSR